MAANTVTGGILQVIYLLARMTLEILGLAAIAYWGWRIGGEGLQRIAVVATLLVLTMALWGIFRVPNDPGPAPVAVPGILRLGLEVVLFGFAAWTLFDADALRMGWGFAALVILHYLISLPRILWLVKQ